jgi:3-hydroxyacyl-[acyl-carrier-protein] dehydratase
MRWIWIDRFTEFRSGQCAKAVKNVTLAEEHLQDHFPGYPMMPASLIIEGLAQTGGILVGEANDFSEMVVLAKLSRVEFFSTALPGDQITYEVTLKDLRPEGAVVDGRAFIGDRPLAEAEIFFAHVDQGRTPRVFGPKYTSFKQEMLDMLDLSNVADRGAVAQPTTATAPTSLSVSGSISN